MNNPKVFLAWQNYNYLPYERDLALQELAALGFVVEGETESGVWARGMGENVHKRVDRLTYINRVDGINGHSLIPQQARLENSKTININGPVKGVTKNPARRQQTRYSAHGLHEYKGKFNPQVARALINILGVQKGDRILDPFCGSGTTLLECKHLGIDAVGVDRNPLAVEVANAKIRALSSSVKTLNDVTERLQKRVAVDAACFEGETAPSSNRIADRLGDYWWQDLPNYSYLEKWFPQAVLAQIVAIDRAIRVEAPNRLVRVFKIFLSDILRDVSWQDPGDLRIRRRRDPRENYPAASLFLAGLEKKIAAITAAKTDGAPGSGSQRAYSGTAEELAVVQASRGKRGGDRFDAAITSPPYANALPYVDTQRFSLLYLDLVPAASLAESERALIGARELGKIERLELEREIVEETEELPTSATTLSQELLKRASRQSNGFRKKNVPALIFRYLKSMRRTMGSVYDSLEVGAPYALIIGTNKTSVGGEQITIDTPALLADIGKSVGFKLERDQTLDTYKRYGLHARNSINGERLIILRK